jgi:hypothetical protein
MVDGSANDDADRLAEAFGDRIRLEVQENLGLPATLNRAIFDLVDTPLVARLDQDDIALPGRIAAQVELLEATGADAALTAYWRVGTTGRRLSLHPDLGDEAAPVAYDPHEVGQVVHSTLLARTAVLRDLGGYDVGLYPAEDFDLSIRLWQHGPVVLDPVPRVDYRVGEDSWSHRRRADMAAVTRYLEAGLADPDAERPPFEVWRRDDHLRPLQRIGLEGRALYRRAGAAFGDGRYFVGTVRLVGAALLNPRLTSRRLRTALRLQADRRSTSPTRQSK